MDYLTVALWSNPS